MLVSFSGHLTHTVTGMATVGSTSQLISFVLFASAIIFHLSQQMQKCSHPGSIVSATEILG